MLRNTTPEDMARRPSHTQRTSTAMERLITTPSGQSGFNEAEIPAATHRDLAFGSATFSRRMTNRYNTELDYVQQRHQQGKDLVFSRTSFGVPGRNVGGGTGEIVELDGKEIDAQGKEVLRDLRKGSVRVAGRVTEEQLGKGKGVVVRRSREQICLETARAMMMPAVPEDDRIEPRAKNTMTADGQKLPRKLLIASKKNGPGDSKEVRQNELSYDDDQETIRKTLTPAIARGLPTKENSPLVDVTTQTRMHVLGTNNEKKLSKLMRMKSIMPKFKGYPQYSQDHSAGHSDHTVPPQDPSGQHLRERNSLASLKQSLKKVTFGLALVRPAGGKSIPGGNTASRSLSGDTIAKASSSFAGRVAEIGGVKYEPTLLGLPSGLRQMITDQVVLYERPIPVCSCGYCDFSWTKQPALARTDRLLRNEILFRYYSASLFTLVNSCLPLPPSQPVRWLAALTREQRSMLRHVEISTKETSSTICMMAGLGLKIVHRIPSYSIPGLMQDERAAVWLTFTATAPPFQRGEVLPPVFQTAPIDLWDGGDVVGEGSCTGEDKRASFWTTGTSIFGGDSELDGEEYDGEVMEGEVVVAGRGKVVDV